MPFAQYSHELHVVLARDFVHISCLLYLAISNRMRFTDLNLLEVNRFEFIGGLTCLEHFETASKFNWKLQIIANLKFCKLVTVAFIDLNLLETLDFEFIGALEKLNLLELLKKVEFIGASENKSELKITQ